MSTLRTRDSIRAWPALAYRDTFAPLDVEVTGEPGSELPPGWHGVFFPPSLALGDLRPDGTPEDDGVTPPIALPRRMFAGEDIEFHRPIRFGEELTLTATLGDLTEKEGRSGKLVFVTVDKVLAGDDGIPAATVHWHDVFLDLPPADAPPPRRQPGPGTWEWEESHAVDATQLFRFSALTWNSHRIHYDRAWAREVERYPDLLVHGPLVELLLLDAARRHADGRAIARFRMKAAAPVFVDMPFRIVGGAIEGGLAVSAIDAEGFVLMHAEVDWA